MRVVVFGDMEGVAGICRWAQVSATGELYQEGRALYTAEINAAVEGAADGGARSGRRQICPSTGNTRHDRADDDNQERQATAAGLS